MSSAFGVTDNYFKDKFSAYPVREIPKNRPLLFQGEIPSMVFYVVSGVIKVYNITSQGEEKIVTYESAGGFLPIEWLFDRAPVSLYYCDTFTDCQVVRLPKDELLNILKDDQSAALALLERSVVMYIGGTMQLYALEQSKVRQKLLSIMQYLVLRFGQAVDKTHSKLELKLTHQEIANLLGATRETISTELGKLSKEGVIKIEQSEYTIDTDKAQRLLGEEDFRELRL
jgi:CRP/FNR family transcriptional regulator